MRSIAIVCLLLASQAPIQVHANSFDQISANVAATANQIHTNERLRRIEERLNESSGQARVDEILRQADEAHERAERDAR